MGYALRLIRFSVGLYDLLAQKSLVTAAAAAANSA
jgi:hypothetical protein